MKTDWKAACALAAGLALAAPASAQSTDGYHTLQVFPVVVDSTTFAQRFTCARQPRQDSNCAWSHQEVR